MSIPQRLYPVVIFAILFCVLGLPFVLELGIEPIITRRWRGWWHRG